MSSQELPPERRARLRELANRCDGADIAVLTGAGISAPSGIPTFRGEGGLWRNHRAEDLASPEGFAKDPRLVWEWYGERREKVRRARPNAAHLALTRLAARARSLRIITQNVDGLHAAADPDGRIELTELHGSIWRTRCTQCERVEANHDQLPVNGKPPHCSCGGLLRPDVVWFGESLDKDQLARAMWATTRCQLFLVVGTSGVVMPAAALTQIADSNGARVAVFDLHPTPHETFVGDCALTLPLLLED